MLLIETTITELVEHIDLWNNEYTLNMMFHGQHGKRAAWTVGNVLITGIEIAPGRVLCEFDNFDLQGTNNIARTATSRLMELLHESFPVDETPNSSRVYRMLARQAERISRVIPAIFADTTLDDETEADFKAHTREKNPDITEEELNNIWQDFCHLVKQQRDKREEQEQRRSMTAGDAAAAWLGKVAGVEAGIPKPEKEGTSDMPNLLLVTVTKDEAQAVLDVFSQASGAEWKRRFIGGKTYYALGSIAGIDVFMAQSEMGIAGPGGAILTIRNAIDTVTPSAVIMVGIAFGTDPTKQQLGDIIVSRQIQAYEPQKLKGDQLIPRGDRVTASTRLLDKFRSGDLDWQGPRVHFGLILSGEKLVANQVFRDRLLSLETEAIGGEMEGAGLYSAASDASVDWILVKSICDWGTEDKDDKYQRIAAENAARFVLHVIQQGGFRSQGETVVPQMDPEKDNRFRQQYQRPILGQIQPHNSSYGMCAVDRVTHQRFFNHIRAYPLDTVGLTFDVTNPNTLDMRLSRFFVDVVEYIDVDISCVDTGPLGGGAIIRKFVCQIDSRSVRYECQQASEGFDYIKLTHGEMETLRIDVMTQKEGVYRLMVALEYSIAGETQIVEADDDVQTIGFFDPACHVIRDINDPTGSGTAYC